MAKKLTRLLVIVALLAMVGFGLTAALGGLNNVSPSSNSAVTALQVIGDETEDDDRTDEDTNRGEYGDPTQSWCDNRQTEDGDWTDVGDVCDPDLNQTTQTHVEDEPVDQQQTDEDEGNQDCQDVLYKIKTWLGTDPAQTPQSAGYSADDAQADWDDLLGACD